VTTAELSPAQLKIAVSLSNLGNVALARGDLPQAAARFRASLGLSRSLGNIEGIVIGLHNLGLVALASGDEAGAAALYRDAFATSEAADFSLGDGRSTARRSERAGRLARRPRLTRNGTSA
jgi:hypothetical protein